MYDQYQHPAITAAEQFGYPRRPKWPLCPVCGWECERYYVDINRDIVACDACFREDIEFDSVEDAREWSEA